MRQPYCYEFLELSRVWPDAAASQQITLPGCLRSYTHLCTCSNSQGTQCQVLLALCVCSHCQALVKSFEVTDLPVRSAKFVARKQWIITGSDDMMVRVYNYNTMDKVKTFEAHTDYIRYARAMRSDRERSALSDLTHIQSNQLK